MSDDRVFNVLFLCTANSARSLMAECILNRLGKGHFRAYSAGTAPAAQVHPETLKLLAGLNYDVSALRPKSWHEFTGPDAPHFDFVFTVCDDAANETCPTFPGEPWHRMSAHWGIPDPKVVGGTATDLSFAFADAYRLLDRRIAIFVALPIRSLDRLALQEHLEQIGQAGGEVQAQAS
ncbi:arsenate reductase ArsC [Xanthobacter sp. AM11]|uniref:arsenate reductase ArsC n=1 Tax=Xanthobacter sp. AM11 TaxID=3380643 RepID=UPI0039BFB1A1